MPILYIVATPIGNLKDITLRALETLKEVDFILCEDTRQAAKLLNHHNISKPLISYFQHSKLSKIEYIIDLLNQGKNLALVTDAGTPGISDPGNQLISQLAKLSPERSVAESKGLATAQFYPSISSGNKIASSVQIIPIPGACAAIAALSVSGFPTDKFIFMGFPPHKKAREKFFKEISEAKYTVIFYESVHRIIKALEKLKEILLDERQIVVCRELTKQFETIYRGNVGDVLEKIKNDTIKGEFVVIVGMKE
ncbi:MAG: Ribosomal RNA small subunit methyltransferase I [Parcubacteria group bacterium GW2011_GWF2_39_13b]|nr:MAG: Ribosomal RNA small subunit methyltransferase I [Parcubacteria group bacterium GW2011_GWF2_39_13b]